jgi:hypothetical protein
MPDRLRAEARRLIEAARKAPDRVLAQELAERAAKLAQRAEVLTLRGVPASEVELEEARRLTEAVK